MSPLEKVVFEKNMCLADTSVGGDCLKSKSTPSED